MLCGMVSVSSVSCVRINQCPGYDFGILKMLILHLFEIVPVVVKFNIWILVSHAVLQ